MKSIRQELLSRDAVDVLSWAFDQCIPANNYLPMPMTAVELEIGGDEVHKILFAGGGSEYGPFIRHGGILDSCYFRHIDNEGWAIVIMGDCIGDPIRGGKIIERIRREREKG